MFVSNKALNGRNLVTNFYIWGEERKRHQLAEEEAHEGTETTITSYCIPLPPVNLFKLLGIFLLDLEKYWP